MIMVPIWLVTVAAGVVVLAIIVTIVALGAWLGIALEVAELRQRIGIVRVDVSAPLRATAPRYHLRAEDDDHEG